MKRCLLWVVVVVGVTACTTTRYVPVESVRTEERDRVTQSVDTVIDNRFVYIRGDTLLIYRDRWHTRQRRDTLLVATHDTIRVPYPVEVPAQLSMWERTKIAVGGYAMAILGVALLGVALRCYLRLRA